MLNGTATPPATLTPTHVAYVNAWFDWNRDGDWADSSDGCSPEWAIQNLPVSMDKLSPGGVAVLPIGFTAGRQTQDIWERVTLTLDQPVSEPNGGGSTSPYTQGEAEDTLLCTGSLPANTHAQGDFQTSASIPPNGAQLYGRQPGSTTFEGPFTLSGP